jgi:hypothetical protein
MKEKLLNIPFSIGPILFNSEVNEVTLRPGVYTVMRELKFHGIPTEPIAGVTCEPLPHRDANSAVLNDTLAHLETAEI